MAIALGAAGIAALSSVLLQDDGLIDLAVNPKDPRRLVATTDRGLFSSTDEARSWSILGPQAGLLAWPRLERLYLLAANVGVFTSGDSGRKWKPAGELAGQPAAFLAASARELHAALHDGTIRLSTDGGRTWTVRATP